MPVYSESFERDIDEIVEKYPESRSALLPILHRIQAEAGWISPAAQSWAAERLDLAPAMVLGVVTFYTMYRTRPAGRHLIQLCRTLSCELRGAEAIKAHIEQRLGIKAGETTSDGLFSLVEVECLGACGTAPAMMIDEEYHEDLSIERVDEIIDALTGAS